MTPRVALLCLSVGLAMTPARAAEPTYAAAPQQVEFAFTKEAFSAWDFDTGWMPRPDPKGGSGAPPIQVRFTGNVGGGMRANAAGDVHLGWSPWQHWATGTPESGALVMDLGVEVQTFMKLDFTFPNGERFLWEGEIPGVEGFDYRFAGEEPFTPFLMAGGTNPAETLVTDAIQKTKLFSVPLTPTLIPIPEVNGTLDVYAGGVLDLILRNGRLVFPQGSLSRADAPLMISPHGETTHATDVLYEATAVYSSILELEPTVVLHVGWADFELAAFPIPVPLAPIEETWSFNAGEPTELSFSLPRSELTDIEGGAVLISGDALDFGEGVEGEQVTRPVRITNVGLANLSGSIAVTGAGYSLDSTESFELEPYATVERVITLQRGSEANTGSLVLTGSDPSGPSTVHFADKRPPAVVPDGGTDPGVPGADGGSTGGGQDGGVDGDGFPLEGAPYCGCSSGAAALFPFGLLFLVGLLRRRQRA